MLTFCDIKAFAYSCTKNWIQYRRMKWIRADCWISSWQFAGFLQKKYYAAKNYCLTTLPHSGVSPSGSLAEANPNFLSVNNEKNRSTVDSSFICFYYHFIQFIFRIWYIHILLHDYVVTFIYFRTLLWLFAMIILIIHERKTLF